MTEQVTLEAWINPAGDGHGRRRHDHQQGTASTCSARVNDGTILYSFAGPGGAGWGWHSTGCIAPAEPVDPRGRGVRPGHGHHLRQRRPGPPLANIGFAARWATPIWCRNELRIGGGRLSDTYQIFNGRIDEVRVWSAARTATEIDDNYNRVLDGDETGLQGYWRFEDQIDADLLRDGDQVRDLSPNLAHGTLRGTLTPTSCPSVDRQRARDGLIVPYGPGEYRIKFGGTLGETLHVPGGRGQPDVLGRGTVRPAGDDRLGRHQRRRLRGRRRRRCRTTCSTWPTRTIRGPSPGSPSAPPTA